MQKKCLILKNLETRDEERFLVENKKKIDLIDDLYLIRADNKEYIYGIYSKHSETSIYKGSINISNNEVIFFDEKYSIEIKHENEYIKKDFIKNLNHKKRQELKNIVKIGIISDYHSFDAKGFAKKNKRIFLSEFENGPFNLPSIELDVFSSIENGIRELVKFKFGLSWQEHHYVKTHYINSYLDNNVLTHLIVLELNKNTFASRIEQLDYFNKKFKCPVLNNMIDDFFIKEINEYCKTNLKESDF